MPAKFCNNLPQPQPSGMSFRAAFHCDRHSHNTVVAAILHHTLAASCSSSALTTDGTRHVSKIHRSRILKYFWTPRNMFGLRRKYYGMGHPLHDPEDHITLQGLYETGTDTAPLVHQPHTPSDEPFYPYPNRNSFSLGDWYWNQGVQKSQEGFRKLIDIIGDPDFKSGDIRSMNWAKINATLAENANDGDDRCSDHRSFREDDGWKRTAISINVPFHHRMAVPGPQSHFAGDLYHRSIVSVIREWVTSNDRDFHYEPYELLWKHNDEAEEVRVHGELYTSAAF